MYVISVGDYEDSHPIAVFEKLEDAKEFNDAFDGWCSIDEVPFNPQSLCPPGLKRYKVFLWENGARSAVDSKNPTEPLEPEPVIGTCVDPTFYSAEVYAADRKEAEEKVRRMQAEKAREAK